MKKSLMIGILFGIGMAIIWSTVFVKILNSKSGIGVGICFGISFVLSFNMMFQSIDKEKNQNKEKNRRK